MVGQLRDTVPNIIKNIVGQISDKGDGTNDITTNNVATTNAGGGSFPTITYAQNFKPVVEWISELSQPDFTGDDRAYMFYVDKDNDLHWFYPTQTTSASIVEGTDEIYSINLSRNNNKIVNMVIFNAGTDCNGNGILWYTWDKTTKSSTLKMKYVSMTDIAKMMFDDEIAAGNLAESSSGTIPYKGKLYYLTSSSGTTSWNESYSSESDYKNKFRERAKALGEARGQKIVQRLGKLTWSGGVEVKGTTGCVAGDLLSCTFPTLGLTNYKLRIVDVQHTFGTNGWITTFQLEEDEEAIAASVVS